MDLEMESRRPLEGVFGRGSGGRPEWTSHSRSGVRVSGQSCPGDTDGGSRLNQDDFCLAVEAFLGATADLPDRL